MKARNNQDSQTSCFSWIFLNCIPLLASDLFVTWLDLRTFLVSYFPMLNGLPLTDVVFASKWTLRVSSKSKCCLFPSWVMEKQRLHANCLHLLPLRHHFKTHLFNLQMHFGNFQHHWISSDSYTMYSNFRFELEIQKVLYWKSAIYTGTHCCFEVPAL